MRDKLCWLIEAAKPSGGVGWLRDIKADGGYDVYMTDAAHQALQFDSRESAQLIINDSAFQHALGHINFYPSEHIFIMSMPPMSELNDD